MGKIYDISRRLDSSTAVWPGDHRFERSETLSLQDGAAVNLSRISFSLHTGTHVDAPCHYLPGGAAVDQLDLSAFWGAAQVVSVKTATGPIGVEALAKIDLRRAPRLLLHTVHSDQPDDFFPDAICYPSLELAAHLARHGIILFGTDAPSVDALDSKTMEVHKALGSYQIQILEGIILKNVPDGVYELAAIPLKFGGADGSPVRALLNTRDS